jgi:nucleotide-binding universal stress UspA family protein
MATRGPVIATEDVMFRPARILVPVDFSDSSRTAVAYARDLARTFGSQLHLLHVIPSPAAERRSGLVPSGDVTARLQEWRRDAMGELEEFAEEHGEPENAMCLALACSSDPADPIVSYAIAESCDLIVMGTHRSPGLTLTGSGTGERVRRRAACPVMLVPLRHAAGPVLSRPVAPQRDARELEHAAC